MWKEREIARFTRLDLDELNALALKQPKSPELQAVMGGRLAESSNYAGAAAALRRATEAGETKPEVWIGWAASEAASGNMKQAVAVLNLAGKQVPTSASQFRKALERLKAAGADATPQTAAQAICPQGVKSIVLAYHKGGIAEIGLPDGVDQLSALAKEKRDDIPTQLRYAEALRRNRKPDEALAFLRPLAEKETSNPDLRLALADTLMEMGESGQAGLQYVAALKLKPDWLPALMGLGKVALERDILAIAVDVHRKAVKLEPDNAENWIGLGKALYSQSLNFGESVDAFKKAVSLAPKRTDYFAEYARAVRAMTDFPEAERIVRVRLATDPNDAHAHFLLGLVLLDQSPTPERTASAEKAFRESLRLVPDVAAVEGRLGRLLCDLDRFAEAIPNLERCLRKDRKNLAALRSLVRAYRKAGRVADSDKAGAALAYMTQRVQMVSALQEKVKYNPGNLQAHKELLAALEATGENAAAEKEREVVALLEKHPKEVSTGLQILRKGRENVTPMLNRGETVKSATGDAYR